MYVHGYFWQAWLLLARSSLGPRWLGWYLAQKGSNNPVFEVSTIVSESSEVRCAAQRYLS